MDSQTAFTVAALANSVADGRTRQTFDRMAFSGLTQPVETTSHELSKQWVNIQAYNAMFKQLSGANRADILRTQVIARVAQHMKDNPSMSEKEKKQFLKQEIAQFVVALNN
eukprot:m.239900 g.239900  ORF g.239900 m.239900 type:complete len:111 (-) comp14193_c0_seq1:52-384(-)